MLHGKTFHDVVVWYCVVLLSIITHRIWECHCLKVYVTLLYVECMCMCSCSVLVHTLRPGLFCLRGGGGGQMSSAQILGGGGHVYIIITRRIKPIF